MLGAEHPQQLIGKPITEFVHPDYRGPVAERMQSMSAEEVGVPLTEEKWGRLDGQSLM